MFHELLKCTCSQIATGIVKQGHVLELPQRTDCCSSLVSVAYSGTDRVNGLRQCVFADVDGQETDCVGECGSMMIQIAKALTRQCC